MSDRAAMATVVNGELDEFQGDTDFMLTGMGAGTDGLRAKRFLSAMGSKLKIVTTPTSPMTLI